MEGFISLSVSAGHVGLSKDRLYRASMSLKGTKFLDHGAVNVVLGKETPVGCPESPALGGWENNGERQKRNIKNVQLLQRLYDENG